MAQHLDGRWVVSPQDIVAEFECEHKVALEAALWSGALNFEPEVDPAMALLRVQGIEHEKNRLHRLESELRVKRLGSPAHSVAAYEAAWQVTAQAMYEEYDVIYQATLFTGDFVGIADFLIAARDESGNLARDADGRVIYNPVDAKSARSAKRGAVLQVGAYGEALVRLGQPEPVNVRLWLAGDHDWIAPAGKFIALAQKYRERVSERLPHLGGLPTPEWAGPREACARCTFLPICSDGRRRDRDLSLIQEIRATTRQKLIDGGIATIDAMADSREDQRPVRVAAETFGRLRAQAALQIQGEGLRTPLFEIIDQAMLNSLPAPSPQDLWFDMEGDPYAPGPNGLEYMFGYGFLTQGKFDFTTKEASDSSTEKTAFEAFIDEVTRRISLDPGMHVYHYANYERRTLQRLAQQYGTREVEIDRILREGRLIDLYSIVRKSLRFSTESLSLKYIEAVYGVSHAGEDVSTAMDSVLRYEEVVALREAGDLEKAESIMQSIRDYNKLDCESTMLLDRWLRSLVTAPPASPPSSALDEGEHDSTDPYAELIKLLEAGLPADTEHRTAIEEGRALLAAALHYHPRERRPAWWKLFELIKAEIEELEHASDVLVVEAADASEWEKSGRMRKHRRTLTVQGAEADPRLILDGVEQAFLLYDEGPVGMARPSDSLRGYNSATVEVLTETHVDLLERAGASDEIWNHLPIAVLPGQPYNTTPIRNAIAAAAQTVLPESNSGSWVFPDQAWADLLLRRAPRTRSGILPSASTPIDNLCAALEDSSDSYVAVQGPPGTGKTFVGSRVVARLAQKGWRIGVVAQSHAVVDNFLEAVHKADPNIPAAKQTQGSKEPEHAWHIKKKVEDWTPVQNAGYVIGGTAWTFSRPTVAALGLDLLVIDEAGQFALANSIACAQAARTVLLLGDPQQLPQVSQAAHPEAIEASVLEHVIHGHATMPMDRGYFLDETYRMAPVLTRAVSDLQYEGRLGSASVTAMRELDKTPQGIISVAVDHHGNTTLSTEEAERVVEISQSLIGRTWIGARNDHQEEPRSITMRDIIVVSAYNAQVRLIRRMLDDAGLSLIRVGTVDKFQGREAVVVIVSMATSSDEDLPRGLEFLLSPNRLNVAISRAQWCCYLVHSKELLSARPSSVEGMGRLGSFLQLIEGATPWQT